MRGLRILGWQLKRCLGTAILLLGLQAPLHASITVLVGEPFGPFGTMMPVGHTAIYLDHVCADGPLKLRMCEAGEVEGVVIARYHRVGNIDWIASPVMQFLYAADRPENVLVNATPATVWALRQKYRRTYLREIVPDGAEHAKATDEWWESAGVAYNRKLWGYQLATDYEQDEALVRMLNSRPNHHAYRLKNNNCADFAADIVNLYFPGAVRRDHIADFGWMTPKQVARSTQAYGKAHPELGLQVVAISQVPGTLSRSRPVRGAAEAGLKTKRYLFTLLAIQPEIPLGCAILYLNHGRWKIGEDARVAGPQDFGRRNDEVLATR